MNGGKFFVLWSLIVIPYMLFCKRVGIMVNNEGRAYQIANETFQDYNIKITADGHQ